MFDYDRFDETIKQYTKDNPNQRKGQIVFNVMYTMYPDAANLFRGTELDPFYNDKKIAKFTFECIKFVNT